MKKVIAGSLGILVGSLVAAHFVSKNRREFRGMNVERTLTVVRIPIVFSLLRATFGGNEKEAKQALSSVGVSYLAMGSGALIDLRLGGMLRKGFTAKDIAFHLATGTFALIIGLLPAKGRPSR